MTTHWGALAVLLLCQIAPAAAAMKVDGRLDEPEWADAQRFADFKTVEPMTSAAPELRTEALVLSQPDGVYVGFIIDQPPGVARVRGRNQRDQGIDVDRITMVVDFEGAGRSAYSFMVSISDSIRDSIVTPVRDPQSNLPNTFNYDWDGDWDHAVSETDTQWFVEIRLPWTIAPMGPVTGGQQTWGMWFSRFVVSTSKRYAQPGIMYERPTYIRDMQHVTLKSYSSAQLDVFPYVAGLRDVVENRYKARAGVDVFWRPHPQHQISATFNPDFGQVEADDLVVNFSAIPTFFPDKRPFFTENLGLFATENRVLYTRRIGAAPDAGPEGSTDIIGAAKYTGNSGPWDYGLIAAVEDESDDAHGRQFYVGRARRSLGNSLSAGWLGTYVDRPTLDRRANVQSVDLRWTASQQLTLIGQAMHSEIHRPDDLPSTPLDPSGSGDGATLHLRYAGSRWEHATNLLHYDRNFQLDDAGFLERNNLNAINDVSTLHFRDYAPDSAILESFVIPSGQLAYNDQGDRLQGWTDLLWGANFRGNGGVRLEWYLADIGGVDDIFTRGNGPVTLPPVSFFYLSYFNPPTGVLRYVATVVPIQGLTSGWGWEVQLQPALYFSERLVAKFYFDYQQQPNYMIWQGTGNLVSTFEYRQLIARAGLEWYPADHHELRALLQWAGGVGKSPQPYRPDETGNLHVTADEVPEFSFSDVALQVRYRWEFRPRSDLYVVYTRGGDFGAEDSQRNLPSLFSAGWKQETASQFLVKVRYRFALL